MQELQNHLEKISREKMSLELKVTELSTFQTEVVSLRNEITTLKVRRSKPHHKTTFKLI